jgi:nucleotide-binding universal stress UspA family protein
MDTIVVGTDHSPHGNAAVEKALRLAIAFDATLHIVTAVHVVRIPELSGAGFLELDHSEEVSRRTRELADSLADRVKVTTAIVRTDPVAGLCEEATRVSASMIVVGNKRVHGLARVLGSIAGGVARSAPCDVLVAHTFD